MKGYRLSSGSCQESAHDQTSHLAHTFVSERIRFAAISPPLIFSESQLTFLSTLTPLLFLSLPAGGYIVIHILIQNEGFSDLRSCRKQRNNMSETPASKIPTREEAKKKITEGVETAQTAVSKAGGFVTPLIDGVVDALGGVSRLWSYT